MASEVKLVGTISVALGAEVQDGVSRLVVLTGNLRIEDGEVKEFVLSGEYEVQDYGRIVCMPHAPDAPE